MLHGKAATVPELNNGRMETVVRIKRRNDVAVDEIQGCLPGCRGTTYKRESLASDSRYHE